jgi:hypothetical protein
MSDGFFAMPCTSRALAAAVHRVSLITGSFGTRVAPGERERLKNTSTLIIETSTLPLSRKAEAGWARRASASIRGDS